MGFFSEIKKLLFVKKSVAKSGIDKVKEESKEAIDDLAAMGKEIKDRTEKKLDNLVEAFTGDDADVSAPDPTEEVESPGLHDALDVDPDESSEAAESSTPAEKSFVEKVGEKTIAGAEELGENILEGAEKAAEKLGDVAETVGKKFNEGKSEVAEKAKQAIEYLDKKLDETVQKAEELDVELSKNDQDKDGFADEPLDIKESTLKDTDDFFEKAKRFAEGQPMDERKPEITIPEKSSKGPKYDTYGFEDRDGDGNEIIDDAIIEEE